jgi:hypothetical protein
MQYILQESELSEQEGSGEEPQPDSADPTPPTQPEALEPEHTTDVSPEPGVIEGEVIVIDQEDTPADHTPRTQLPYWLHIPLTIVLCLLFVAGSLLTPVLTPTATITLLPVTRSISLTSIIQVTARHMPALTLTQRILVPATGHRHQDAARAHGVITMYNGQFHRLTIAAGTIFMGMDGVQVITDQVAVIPAGNPPSYGQASVPAHAVLPGAQGNIPAYDINTACCAPSVFAKNTTAFIGGAGARDIIVVTRADINTAVTSLLLALNQGEDAALRVQLHEGEALLPTACAPHIPADHQPGEEAQHDTITVSLTCGGIAYTAHDVYEDATKLLTARAATTLGADYAQIGATRITIDQASITNSRQGQAHMRVHVSGTVVYRITPAIQQRLTRLIAGKTREQAAALLVQYPGIAGVSITMRGGNRTLPQDPKAIRILVQYTPD